MASSRWYVNIRGWVASIHTWLLYQDEQNTKVNHNNCLLVIFCTLSYTDRQVDHTLEDNFSSDNAWHSPLHALLSRHHVFIWSLFTLTDMFAVMAVSPEWNVIDFHLKELEKGKAQEFIHDDTLQLLSEGSNIKCDLNSEDKKQFWQTERDLNCEETVWMCLQSVYIHVWLFSLLPSRQNNKKKINQDNHYRHHPPMRCVCF